MFIIFALFVGFMNMEGNDPIKGKQNTDPKLVTYNFTPKIEYRSPNAILKFVDSLDGNNTIAGLASRGYLTYFNGTPPAGTSLIWYQGDPGAIGFPAFNGPTTGFVQSDFNSIVSGNIDNWLVLPKINISTGDSLFFYSGSYNSAAYPDSIRVMYSAAGDSIPSATSWVELGRFKLTSYMPNSIVPWAENGFRAPSSGLGRFAIRYCVYDGGPNGANSSTIGIDYIRVISSAAYPLNAFNLQTPTAGVTVTSLIGSTTPISITWDTSATGASYKWIFGTSLPTRIHTIPAGTNSITMTLGQLDDLLATFGLALGDSISGAWDVWAFKSPAATGPDSMKSTNGPRTITLKRQKPALTPFALVSPVSGARIETAGGSNTPVVINWRKSGAGTTYKWFYASPNFSSASNIKFRLPADNTGFDSTLSTTSNALDGMLSGIGVAMGDSSVGQWRVYAYSGSDSLASSQTNNITFKRLPIATACIGTGTTSTSYPFYTLYEDSRTQMLYTAAEITAAGGSAGFINRLGFTILTVGSPAMSGFSVKMQTITGTTISTWTTTGWSEVYTSSAYTPPGTGLQYIDLATPYFWNGTGSLLIEVCFDNADWSGNSTVAGTTQTGTVVHNHVDGSSGCTLTATSTAATRPNICLVLNTGVGVNPAGSTVPQVYSLSQNYPNPFNPTTKINFALPKQGLVTLKIYDILGREVRTLVNEIKTAGNYTVDFNASEFASGVYFYRLQSEGFTDIKKMMLVK